VADLLGLLPATRNRNTTMLIWMARIVAIGLGSERRFRLRAPASKCVIPLTALNPRELAARPEVA